MKNYKENFNNIDNIPSKLDVIDKKILNILQSNNQVTNVELAEKVGLLPSSLLMKGKANA
jgi:DNA-binding Lrp family transcriptional regulator